MSTQMQMQIDEQIASTLVEKLIRQKLLVVLSATLNAASYRYSY